MRSRVLKLIAVYDDEETVSSMKDILENALGSNKSALITDIDQPEDDTEFTLEYSENLKDKLVSFASKPEYVNKLFVNEAVVDYDEQGSMYEVASKFLGGDQKSDDTTPNYESYLATNKKKKKKRGLRKDAFSRKAPGSDKRKEKTDPTSTKDLHEQNDDEALDTLLPDVNKLKEQTSYRLDKDPDMENQEIVQSLTFAHEQPLSMIHQSYKQSLSDFNELDLDKELADFKSHLQSQELPQSVKEYKDLSNKEIDFAKEVQQTVEGIQNSREQQFEAYLKEHNATDKSDEEKQALRNNFESEYPDDTGNKSAQYIESIRDDYSKLRDDVEKSEQQARRDLIDLFKDYANKDSINDAFKYIEVRNKYQEQYDNALQDLKDKGSINSGDYDDQFIEGLDDYDEDQPQTQETTETDQLDQQRSDDDTQQDEGFTPDQINEFEEETDFVPHQQDDNQSEDNTSESDESFDDNDPFGDEDDNDETESQEIESQETDSNDDETSNDDIDDNLSDNDDETESQETDSNEQDESSDIDKSEDEPQQSQDPVSSMVDDINNDTEIKEQEDDLIKRGKQNSRKNENSSRNPLKKDNKSDDDDEDDNISQQETEYVNPFVKLWNLFSDKSKKWIKILVPSILGFIILLLIVLSVVISNSDSHQEKKEHEQQVQQQKHDKKMKEIAHYTKGKKLPAVDKKTQSRINFLVTDVNKDGGVTGYYYKTKDGKRVKEKKTASPEAVQDYIKRMKAKEEGEKESSY